MVDYYMIQIQTMMGERREINVSSEMTVADLKYLIVLQLDIGVFPDDQILMFNSSELKEDEKTLGEYGIEELDTLMLMVRIESGLMW